MQLKRLLPCAVLCCASFRIGKGSAPVEVSLTPRRDQRFRVQLTKEKGSGFIFPARVSRHFHCCLEANQTVGIGISRTAIRDASVSFEVMNVVVSILTLNFTACICTVERPQIALRLCVCVCASSAPHSTLPGFTLFQGESHSNT